MDVENWKHFLPGLSLPPGADSIRSNPGTCRGGESRLQGTPTACALGPGQPWAPSSWISASRQDAGYFQVTGVQCDPEITVNAWIPPGAWVSSEKVAERVQPRGRGAAQEKQLAWRRLGDRGSRVAATSLPGQKYGRKPGHKPRAMWMSLPCSAEHWEP